MAEISSYTSKRKYNVNRNYGLTTNENLDFDSYGQKREFQKIIDNLSHQLRMTYSKYGGSSVEYKRMKQRLKARGFLVTETSKGGNISLSQQNFTNEEIADVIEKKENIYKYGRQKEVKKRIEKAMKDSDVPEDVTVEEYESIRSKVSDFISNINQSFYEMLLSGLNRGLTYKKAKQDATVSYYDLVGEEYKKTNLSWELMKKIYSEQIAGKEKQFKSETTDFLLNKAKMEMDRLDKKQERQQGFLGHNDMLLYKKAQTEYKRLLKQKKKK